jgi:hypothetical protein
LHMHSFFLQGNCAFVSYNYKMYANIRMHGLQDFKIIRLMEVKTRGSEVAVMWL